MGDSVEPDTCQFHFTQVLLFLVLFLNTLISLQVNQRIIDSACHRKAYYASKSAKEDVRLCNNLPFGKIHFFLFVIFCCKKCLFSVPLEFLEQASRDLRAYLSSKRSIALCILDHLDLNYIFGDLDAYKLKDFHLKNFRKTW